jgi:ketosteroid isomerase-like protein
VADSDRIERVREAYRAFSEGDFESAIEALDERVEWWPPATSLEPQPLHGREAVLEYLKPNIFSMQSAEPREVIEEGDRILVVARVRARGRESGIEFELTNFHLWEVEGDRVVRFRPYEDRAEALAALHEPARDA